MKNIKLVATDLDGTFLRNDRTVSEANLEALTQLGNKNIIRVAATGRNLQKVRDVLKEDVPFDYIVFSSGAGVYNWQKKEHISQQNIKEESAEKLLKHFVVKDVNFHAFFPVPENYKHFYFRGKASCEEFERYFTFNKADALPLDTFNLPEGELCQFLVILKQDEEKFRKLKAEIEALCPEIRVIRASSPITKGYIWLEIFHKSVSKADGVNHICELLGIDKNETMGIGNDYNDFDLLDFTGFSFITENAPNEIHHKYSKVPSNEDDAFAHSVQPLLAKKM